MVRNRTLNFTPVFNFPTKITDYDGVVSEYVYDGNGNLLDFIQGKDTPSENRISNTYDANGNVASITYAGDANTIAATYSFTYDSYGNLTSRTDALGETQYFTNIAFPNHDVLGNAPVVVNELNKTWTFDYDLAGNALDITDPIGRVLSYTYNDSGDLINLNAINSSDTVFIPNASGLPTQVTDALNQTSSLTYSKSNQLIKVTNPLGNASEISYDGQNRLDTLKDGEGNETGFSYNKGLVTNVTYPTYSQTLAYDVLDRVTQVTDLAAGDISQPRRATYDLFGNTTSRTDALDRDSTFEYDAQRRQTKITNAESGEVTWVFDDRNNLKSVTDPENATTSFVYDANDRLLSETRPEGEVRSYTYLANGLLETSTNPAGQITTYSYDDANQLTGTNFYINATALTNNTPNKTITFTYNDLGQLTGYADGATSGTYTYDLIGQLTNVSVDYGPFIKNHSYTYDSGGRKTTYTNPEGVTYTYQYNKNNDFLGLAIPGEGQITVNTYQWLSPVKLTYPGGVTLEDDRDGLLRLDLRVLKDSATNELARAGYTYNDENQITQVARDDGSSSYQYDALDRLTGSSEFNESFTYDGIGNRTTTAASTTAWTYNQNHQLLTTPDRSYVYNANGHRSIENRGAETLTYSYDLEERLTQITSSISGVLASYTYDPFGRRLSKTVSGITTYFYYNETGLVGEYDAAGQLISEYHYTPGQPWMTDPLFKRDGVTNTVHYYFNDHLGTPRKMFTQSGEITWSATYAAFGQATVGVETTSNPLRFSGQYYDGESGLHYNYYRHYDPSTGTYIQQDPAGLAGGLHPYLYVYANPLSLIDPLGLWGLGGFRLG